MAKILIDPGHGGRDSGAIGSGLIEKELTLEVALRVGEILKGRGHTVGYTRTKDENIGVYERGQMAKGYDYILSIHFNSNLGEPGTGSEVVVSNAETYANTEIGFRDNLKKFFTWRRIYSRRFSDGAIVIREIDEDTKMFINTVDDKNWYGVLRGAESVGINGDLLEIAFINNPKDMEIYINNKDEIIMGIADAIDNAFARTTNINNSNKYRVNTTLRLNCRAGGGLNYKIVRQYEPNTILEIISVLNGWGKTNDGWVSMEWLKKI